MDASPAARRVAFAVIVCAFAALGTYLLVPRFHHARTPEGKPPAASPRLTPVPAQSAVRAAGPPSIYQWLPFTQAGLTAAAGTAVRFCDAYGTYSYTEDGAAYVAPLQAVASAQLVGRIEAAYEAPGLAATRHGEKQVSVGTATITSIRAFGPGSLTFVVLVVDQITSAGGRSQPSTTYAVTVTGSGTTWQVSDVELASAGNS
ncbi:MAG TPA: hypothetical protein VEV45_25375 [Streptosporangiaceae bacterium]|nr:hypothetical protein [Streptosporangiaceae bacterium]